MSLKLLAPPRLAALAGPHLFRSLALATTLLSAGGAGAAQTATMPWQDAPIGAPPNAGSHEWDGTTLKVSGEGAGLNLKNADQVQFVSVPHAAGDFEISARLTGLSDGAGATTGIMVRGDAGAKGPMVCLYFRKKEFALNWLARVPGETPDAPSRQSSSGIVLAKAGGEAAAMKPPAAPDPDQAAAAPPAPETLRERPLWLRLVRLGDNFAVYKSRDGKLWSVISNVSGGAFPFTGPFQVGFFVSGTPAGDPITASFDSISIGPAHMRYKTGWVGNSFGSRPGDGHVSNALSAMWVAPDGTCYTSSYWDEGGEPCKAYRDGQILNSLPIGTPQTSDGGITGDGKNVFVATVDRVTILDPAVPGYAPRPLPLSTTMLDKKTNNSAISGMASNGKELFVADARENLIRVVTLQPQPLYHKVEAANDGIMTAPAPVIVPDAAPEGSPPCAPAIVYQTERVGEGSAYVIGDLTPAASYTVRCHFAEYTKRNPAKPNIRVAIGNNWMDLNITELAGGLLKPYVKDFAAKAGADGKIPVHFQGALFGVCAIEVLDEKGKRVWAVNCGGPAVGDFKGENAELVSRDFAFERPGPMAFDKRGDLWIVQRANDFPTPATLEAKYPAAVRCYSADGKFTGREIKDVAFPRALAYDAAKDELLVGENNSDLNVRIYGGLGAKPVLARTFGEKGGIYSGATPGLVIDAAAGRAARFAGITGLGVDQKGNLYVGGGMQGSDLRQFTPAGEHGWMIHSLMFCNTYDFDPASDGTQIYGTYNHIQLDLTKTAPGAEQKYIGYNWDLRKYGAPDRAGNSQSIVRRVGPSKQLVMYTSGQGTVGDVKIFRYEGEIAVPCGDIRGPAIWIDKDGDGKEQPDEVTKMASAIGWNTGVCADSKGDLWVGVPGMGGSFARHFTLKSTTDKGVPMYNGVKGEGYEDIPFPEEGGKTSGWGMACRLDYDADRDIMVMFSPLVRRTGEGDKSAPQYAMARYDNWSKGNREHVWKIKVPTPYTDPDYYMYETNFYPYSGYMGMQIAGDYVFMAYLFGEVHVFDLKTGKLVEILAQGPEVCGQSAWEDAAMGLRATKTKAGEYLVFTENSGWGGKCNFYRWKP